MKIPWWNNFEVKARSIIGRMVTQLPLKSQNGKNEMRTKTISGIHTNAIHVRNRLLKVFIQYYIEILKVLVCGVQGEHHFGSKINLVNKKEKHVNEYWM